MAEETQQAAPGLDNNCTHGVVGWTFQERDLKLIRYSVQTARRRSELHGLVVT